MHTNVKQFIKFCLFILIQTQVLDKIMIRWWTEPSGFPIFVPFLYPLFILLLPLSTPVWLLLFVGFTTGLSVDLFNNTAGMHAFACVLMAYLRTNVLNALLPKNLSEYGQQVPGVKVMGWMPFLTYSAFLLLILHLTFFTLEIWSFSNIGYLLLKVLASTITSMLLVVGYLLLFTNSSSIRNK
ncbi:MAG TPA: rod shape-determining protein MreD [Flavipsychrobacter sp.]|jgi:rod shape-determining protein MreD|nr:rod shape-determining protein MreD [Flavipsychrobacter sp.]